MGRDKVDLFARIRDDRRLLGLGIRELAGKYGVHRRLVREALASPVPAPRKRPSRESPVLDAVAGLIDGMLREDLDAPRKQRHTSRRIWQRLADEHDAEVSYSYVCQYAGQRRAQIEAEHRAAAAGVEGFVPQAKEPGAEAEVDFGLVSVVIGGDQAACHLFAYRLSYSGKGVHRPVDRTTGAAVPVLSLAAGSSFPDVRDGMGRRWTDRGRSRGGTWGHCGC